MVKWFLKPKKPIEVIPLDLHVTHGQLSVTHLIRKEKDPIPVRGHLVWTNQNGQRWVSQPFVISGQQSFPIQVPIAWLTGRDKDIAKLPLDVILMLEY